MIEKIKRWLGDVAYTAWGLILLAYAFFRFVWGDEGDDQ